MSGYGDLLRTRGVARIIAAQLTARFPSGMLSLAYLLHVEGIFDSYGAAGPVMQRDPAGIDVHQNRFVVAHVARIPLGQAA